MVAGMLASSGKTPLFVSQQTTKYFKFSDLGHSWVSSFKYSNVQSGNCENGFFSLSLCQLCLLTFSPKLCEE